jgi:hypothetical protein
MDLHDRGNAALGTLYMHLTMPSEFLVPAKLSHDSDHDVICHSQLFDPCGILCYLVSVTIQGYF